MVILGRWVFLMGEVLLYATQHRGGRTEFSDGRSNYSLQVVQGYLAHKNSFPLGPYGRPMPRALRRF